MKKISALIFVILIIFGGEIVGAVELNGIDIHGFISQGYLLSDKNNALGNSEDGSFQFNEMGINFSREMTENLRLGIQIFSRDLGQFENNKVIVDWAYGDYHWKDRIGFRAGIIRQAHGLYNQTRDVDMLRTAILLPPGVYDESNRDYMSRIQGASVYGEIPMQSAGSLSYMFLIGSKHIDENGVLAKWVEAPGIYTVTDFNSGIFYNGKFEWRTPVRGLRIGASGTKSTDIQIDVRTKIPLGPVPVGTTLVVDVKEFYTYALSIEYIFKDLTLAAEHNMSLNDNDVNRIHPFGCYASAAYRFTDWFEAGAYYSVFYSDKDDKDGDALKKRGLQDYRAWQKDFALSTRFNVNENWSIKLEGHLIDGVGQLLSQENPDGFEKNWYLLAAKVTFNF